jgi:hypothetical protein
VAISVIAHRNGGAKISVKWRPQPASLSTYAMAYLARNMAAEIMQYLLCICISCWRPLSAEMAEEAGWRGVMAANLRASLQMA